MAPSNIYGGYYGLTPVSHLTGKIYYANPGAGRVYYANPSAPITKKTETKKERIQRVAKEKMFASWDMHHQKTPTTIEIVQICKPRHLNYLRR